MIDAVDAERRALHDKIARLEKELVAYDALLSEDDGKIAAAAAAAPGLFELRRRHATTRVPAALLERVFGADHAAWVNLRPTRYYMSAPLKDQADQVFDLAGVVRSMSEPNGVKPLQRWQNNLPKSGSSGLPKDWRWLVLSWSIEIREDTEWDCTTLEGSVRLIYNSLTLQERPLSDALKGQDLDLCQVFEEYIGFNIAVEVRQGPRPYLRQEGVEARPPRLYCNLDVIEDVKNRWY